MNLFDLFANIWIYLSAAAILPVLVIWLIYKRSCLNWRIIEICALLLGAIGFLTPAFTVQQMANKIEANQLEGWSRGHLRTLGDRTYNLMSYCVPYIRSEFSPNDFDLLLKESKLVCSWATNFNDIVSKLNVSNYREIPDRHIATFPSVAKAQFRDGKDEMRKAIDEWNALLPARREKDEKARIDVPIELIFFSPYLLALAFSLTAAGIIFKPRH